MSAESAGQDDATPGEGPPNATPRRSPLYRFRRYCYRKAPSLFPDPDRHKILRESRSRDAEQNVKTTPPADELIDLRCVWAVEFYTPSQVSQLLRGFEKLGWDRDDPTGFDQNPSVWIRQFRESALGGGWFNLGLIDRPGSRRFFPTGRTAPLPAGIDYALGAMYSLTSSITCIVVTFILTDEFSRRFDQALRRDRETVLERLPARRYRLPGPPLQKEADVKAIRADIRALAAGWFRTHLPGLFAGGVMTGEFPTCEFITLRKAIPFPGRDELDCATGEWLRILDIDHDFDAWQAEQLPGLKFTWPLMRDTEGRFHAVIAAREDAFPEDQLQAYGGGGRIGYVLYVDALVRSLLSRWALLGVLTGFERHLNNIRDSATFDPHQRAKPPELLKSFGSHVAHSVGISAASVELRRFSEHKRSFDYEFEVFKPCNPRRYRDDPITLSDALREQIGERSEWLRNIDHSVRDLLMQYGTILGTRENIELQNRMSAHTKIMVFLTVVITVLTAVTTLAAIKAGNITWPW